MGILQFAKMKVAKDNAVYKNRTPSLKNNGMSDIPNSLTVRVVKLWNLQKLSAYVDNLDEKFVNKEGPLQPLVPLKSLSLSLFWLMTHGHSKDIRCQVWPYSFLYLQITGADIRTQAKWAVCLVIA